MASSLMVNHCAKPISLVTGCAGFIGSHVSAELIRMGHVVVGLDDLSGGYEENNPPGIIFHNGSVSDVECVNRLFQSYKFSYVFHLAAYAAEGLSHFIRKFNYTNNIVGSVNLINASVNAGSIRTFVFTSSIAVYGSGRVPMLENMVPSPEDPYGIAKYAVELDLKAANKMFGLNYIIFRPHNVYGERQNIGDKYRNVIGIFINQLMHGAEMTIFGDGAQTRAFTHVSEIAPIVAHSVERPQVFNRVFNLGTDIPHTVLEAAHTVAEALDVQARIRFLEPRQEPTEAYCTHDLAREVFGDLMMNVPLDKGVRQMVAWAKQNVRSPKDRRIEIDVRKNLPPFWDTMGLC